MRSIFIKLAACAIFLLTIPTVLSAAEDPLKLDFATKSKLSETEFRRRNRGMVQMSNIFVSEGQWVVGGTASYTTHLNSDYNFLVIEDIASEGYNVKVSPLLAYIIRDNLSLGARFEYGRTLMRVDNASLSVGDPDTGIDLSVTDVYTISQSFQGMLTGRQYVPLGHSKRFALFTELRLGIGGSRSKYAFDSPVQGIYSKSVDASLSVAPGIVAFATNRVAFEVTVGALGISYSHVDQLQNQVYESEYDSSSMSFMVNLFSIGLGVAFYL